MNTTPLCEASAPLLTPMSDSVYCTRERGHSGDHIATVGPYREGLEVLKRWASTTTDNDKE
jgi:hypothetical protein